MKERSKREEREEQEKKEKEKGKKNIFCCDFFKKKPQKSHLQGITPKILSVC